MYGLPARVYLRAVWQTYNLVYSTKPHSQSVVLPEWVYAVDSETAELKADITDLFTVVNWLSQLLRFDAWQNVL